MSDSDTEAENAARLAVWRENVACWTVENQKPWRDRSEFCIAELASELAWPPGQIKLGRSECEQIVSYIYRWATQGECDEADVLMIVNYSRRLAPFLSEYRDARAGLGDRQFEPNPDPDCDVNYPVLDQLPNRLPRLNIGAIILTRRAVRALLDGRELPGASQLRRRLGCDAHEQEHVSKAAGVRSSPSSDDVASATPAPQQVEGGGAGDASLKDIRRSEKQAIAKQPRLLGRPPDKLERVKSEMREKFGSDLLTKLTDRTWTKNRLANTFKTSPSTADRARTALLSELPKIDQKCS
jgi:hypothetical protein